MPKEMADYLPVQTADYIDATFSLVPQDVMSEEGKRNQVMHEFDDGSVHVVSISNQTWFTCTLQWAWLSYADAGIIMDFYHNQSKANGRARTFYWLHPLDGHTYVVRFMDDLKRVDSVNKPMGKEIPQVTFRVEGVKAP